jgi:hypothetical protein
MKKHFVLLLMCFLLESVVKAQAVKAKPNDSANAYRANDRLRTAGPKDGWKSKRNKSKTDSVSVKKDTIAPARRITARKKAKAE